jgi:hypothetical protein
MDEDDPGAVDARSIYIGNVGQASSKAALGYGWNYADSLGGLWSNARRNPGTFSSLRNDKSSHYPL